MSGLSRWRAEHGQRRHHREFRIPEPVWTAGQRARLTALLAEIAASTPSTVDERPAPVEPVPRADPALREKDLADAATNLWRARRRIARLDADDSREARFVGRYLRATQEALAAAGVLIQDHDGSAFHPGLSLEVLAYQEDPVLRSEIVRETVRPSVYLADRRIQMGQVIVGCPAERATAGSANTDTPEGPRA